MDRQRLDQDLIGLASGLRALQWDRDPEQALRTCVAEVGALAVEAPPELRDYLVDRLQPVLSEYGIDATRLLCTTPPRRERGDSEH